MDRNETTKPSDQSLGLSASRPVSTTAPYRAMSTLQPTMVIKRGKDNYVPLIAVDELPESVVLIGVPTSLSLEEMADAGLVCKGEQSSHGKFYQLKMAEIDTSSEGSQYSSSSAESRSSSKKFVAPDAKASRGNAAKKAMEDREADVSEEPKSDDIQVRKCPTKTSIRLTRPNHLQTKIDSITATSENVPHVPKPASNNGTFGKKVYCTYFLNTGNCDYMQVGCRYSHDLPDDEETRTAIGLRKLPTWMRDDPAVPIKPLVAKDTQSWTAPKNARPKASSLCKHSIPSVTPSLPSVVQDSSARSQSINQINGAQQVPLFSPPQHHFPSQAGSHIQRPPSSFAGSYPRSNDNVAPSPIVQISADSFSRSIPAKRTDSSYANAVASPMQARPSYSKSQELFSHPSSAQPYNNANADMVSGYGQQQTSGRGPGYNQLQYSASRPNSHASNSTIFTPSHTNSSTGGFVRVNHDVHGNSTNQEMYNTEDSGFAGQQTFANAATNNKIHSSSSDNHHYTVNAGGSASNSSTANANTATLGTVKPSTLIGQRTSTLTISNDHTTHEIGQGKSDASSNANTAMIVDSSPHMTENQPLMSYDIHQLNLDTQPLEPATIIKGNANLNKRIGGYISQSEASHTGPCSPAYVHKRMFVKEGEPRYVVNQPKEKHNSSDELHIRGRGSQKRKNNNTSPKGKHHGKRGDHSGKHYAATLSES